MRLHPIAHIAAKALTGGTQALDLCGRCGREVDVVENTVIVLGPDTLVQKALQCGQAVHARGLECVVKIAVAGAVILAERHGGHALKRRLHRGPDGAGIDRVFGGIVAAIDAREHEVRAGVLHHVMQARKDAIGGAALGGKAARAHLCDHHRAGVGNAVTNAGLLEGGGHGPDFTSLTGEGGGDVVEHDKAGGIDAVVIGDQNAHRPAPFSGLVSV